MADVSGSVDSNDFRLLQDGFASAFRDPTVQAGITRAQGGVAVTLVHWADYAVQAIGWTHLTDAASANAFAEVIGRTPRAADGGTVMIGALRYSSTLFDENGFEGGREVIDVSGDGADSRPCSVFNVVCVPLQNERDAFLSGGANRTINALWIEEPGWFSDDPADVLNALTYGTTNVIGGPGAFQAIVSDFASFAEGTSAGVSVSAQIQVSVVNLPPVLQIVQPSNAARVCLSSPVDFTAAVTDPNNPAAFPFPAAGVAWRYTGPANGNMATGFTVRQVFTIAGTYTVLATATDEIGASHTQSITLTVAGCTNMPPVVQIVSPVNAPADPDLEMWATASDAHGWYIDLPVRASATDAEDGTLTGSALRWFTTRGDRQPGASTALGTGTAPTVRLYTTCVLPDSGLVDHTIRVVATDSAGNEVQALPRVIRVRLLC